MLPGNETVLAEATLLEPADLINFSQGLGGHTPPIQVSPGRLSGKVMRIDLGHVELMYETCNRDLVFEDDPLLIGACMYREEQSLQAHLPGERGLIARPANTHAVYVLCKAGLTERACHPPGYPVSSVLPSWKDFWTRVDTTVDHVGKHVGTSVPSMIMPIPTAMLAPIIARFRSALAVHETRTMERQDEVLWRFFNQAKHDAFANIEEIAGRLAMTRRNLHYCASGRLGIPPKRLIKSMALRNVMCQLPADCSRNRAIAEIAFLNGFESPAQFSFDYRKHFGERPSETRQRYQ